MHVIILKATLMQVLELVKFHFIRNKFTASVSCSSWKLIMPWSYSC